MIIRYQRSFINQFEKLSKSKIQLAKEAVELFTENPKDYSLRNHKLRGKWSTYCSITADSDLRLHYRQLDSDAVLFVAVGTHKQLYK